MSFCLCWFIYKYLSHSNDKYQVPTRPAPHCSLHNIKIKNLKVFIKLFKNYKPVTLTLKYLYEKWPFWNKSIKGEEWHLALQFSQIFLASGLMETTGFLYLLSCEFKSLLWCYFGWSIWEKVWPHTDMLLERKELF